MTTGLDEHGRASAASDRLAAWRDDDDEIIGGDLTAALAYCTPAGGAVATPVAPVGLRDRASGTVSFTTSLGFGRKLDRIAENPRVALAYHAREHGFARSERFVLVQGQASFEPAPRPGRSWRRSFVPHRKDSWVRRKRGVSWDWWLRAYYASRIVVTVHVERVSSWPDLECRGARNVVGRPVTDGPPVSQRPPRGGTAPRVELGPAARRLNGLPHVLAAYVGADGFPEIVPVALGRTNPSGISLYGPLPLGARRAGLLAHSYEPQLIGLRTVTHTGWLDEGTYAPHTAAGFRAPANKTFLLLANGFAAQRGQGQAGR